MFLRGKKGGGSLGNVKDSIVLLKVSLSSREVFKGWKSVTTDTIHYYVLFSSLYKKYSTTIVIVLSSV